jgi:monoamine oxidase
VLIVGGGIAGLHCAHRLAQLGASVSVYEAQGRLGGRVFTDRMTFPEGQHCELGGELIDSSHSTMFDLAAEFSIDLLDYNTDDPALRPLVPFFKGRALSDQEVLDGFTPIAAQIDAALATLTDQDDLWVYYDKPNGGEALDALSLSAWLDSVEAAGPVRSLLEVAYVTEYGLDADVTNCLNLLFLISTATERFDVFGDSDERYHAREGNERFIAALAGALGPDRIKPDHRLVALAKRPDGSYVATFEVQSGRREVLADHVVLALPFSVLREVDIDADFDAQKIKVINEIGYGTNAKLMCGFSSRPWREALGSNGETFTDLAYQSTWETSRLQPGAAGILTNYTGGRHGVEIGAGTPESQAAAFLDQLEQVYPGVKAASNGKVARMHWPTVPTMKGSYSAYKVGQYSTLSGSEVVRAGNVHFCGEHTSLDAQGYIEGGALSGSIAADEVAADLGLAMPLASSLLLGASADPVERILARARLARIRRRLGPVLGRPTAFSTSTKKAPTPTFGRRGRAKAVSPR